MASASPPYFNSDILPFSSYGDSSLRDNIFSGEVFNSSNRGEHISDGQHQVGYQPLDLTVRASPEESQNIKRKFDESDFEENVEKNKRQRSFSDTKPIVKTIKNQQLGPLSIVPPSTNPYLNADMLSPLSIAPVPTPFMPLYNMGSPSPPSAGTSSAGSYVSLTPPQTPQAVSFPFQMPQTSNYQVLPQVASYPPITMPYFYNPYNPQMNQMHLQPVANKTPSPPPDNQESKKVRKILPKPNCSPHSLGSPALQPRLQESSLAEQKIHILPLSSPATSTLQPSDPSNTTSYSYNSHLPPAIASPQVHQPRLYPSYDPYQSSYPYPPQEFNQKPEPKPMSHALSFLFEKSLGSVRRWRENGLTIQVFYCAVCQCPTDSEERLMTHIETFHSDLGSLSPSPGGVYQCQECEQVCQNEEALARHKLIHPISSKEKEKCKGCGRNFLTQDSLANHERDCTLYRPYRCDYCGRGYVIAARLKHHRQFCSSAPKPPIFTCKICNKTFENFLLYCNHVPVHAFM